MVTGGCGFIGSHVVDLLISRGYKVVVIDNLSTGNLDNLNPRAIFIEADVTNYESIKGYFQNINCVFHMAALPRIQPSFDDPLGHEDANVIGTINCMLASRKNKVEKFIFAGSSSCYGNTEEIPTSEQAPINCLSPYALQKYTAEQYCLILGERYGMSVNSVRYFNPYGPRSFNPENKLSAYSSVVGIFNNQSKTGKLTVTGTGEQSRDFIHVYDLAEATVLAAERDITGEVLNVGFGESHTVNYLASLFDCEIEYIPERKGEAQITLANIEKTKRLLQWSPKISLQEGIKLL
jgi:UDP-glucose 4-epimerase